MRWIVVFCYMAIVSWLSLAPAEVFQASPLRFAHADKLMHFGMYGVLAFLLCRALRMSGRRACRWRWVWVALASTGYGFLMELAQLVMISGDRYYSLADVAANALGASVAVFLYRLGSTLHARNLAAPSLRRALAWQAVGDKKVLQWEIGAAKK